ncbi:MAG TPA: aminotransferase class I/II-fold pyridoxal phosphate-dependent enzyme [Anaerolineae bacterium]|nr:aminotransferase class I/II-fold pyridoxal phosphate-dependent enzyme [Anaerolineae bacterium]
MKFETFALERWMSVYEMKVEYDIAESGIFPQTVNELLSFEPESERDQVLNRLLDLRLGYSEASGTLELRSLLAETYTDCNPENILVTTGAIEANFLLFNVLLNPGDHVVAPYPAYQQLYSVPRAIGCDVSLWRVNSDQDFRFDLDELERLVRPETQLIVVNSPHNPTGAMLSAADTQRVYDIARSVGAMVLSDEVYRWLTIPGGDVPAPPMYDLGPSGISVGTLSKPFGLPGLRLGWMAAPAEIIAECWATRDYVSLSPGKLNDALAILAIKHRDKIIKRNEAIIAANLSSAGVWFNKHADILSWSPPRGGLLALLRYNLDIPSLELANKLAEEYSVMLAPGSAFGYEHHLRIGIGQAPATFVAGLERASACFADLRAGGAGRIRA